jgi:hypothetical protein
MGGYGSRCGTVEGLSQGLVCTTSKCVGAPSCEDMDMCSPPDSDMVAQVVLQWAGSCRQHLPLRGATVQNTYTASTPRHWVASLDHIHIFVLG